MRGVFFYGSILALASGIFVRSFFVTGWHVIAWLFIITMVLWLWWLRQKNTNSSPKLFFIVIILGCFTLGLARLELTQALKPLSQFTEKVGSKVELMGVVVTEPEVTARSKRIVVEVARERILVTTDRYANVTYGDEIILKGTLEKPERFETEFGRIFDYPSYLAVRDIFYTVSFAQIEVQKEDQGNRLLATLYAIKQLFLLSIQQHIPEPEVGLGAGLLLGVKSSLGEELEDDFRTTGIIHIVVLSGANIMLVVIFVMFALSFVLPVRTRAVVGIVAIVLFALLVGLSATVVRASLMASLILVALLIGKRYNIMRALFFTGAVMVFINPLLLVHDVGFQLSFMATLGLVLVAPQLEALLTGVTSGFKLKEYFVATVATQVAILPLLLYHIGQFSVVAIAVNMLVLPAVPAAMLTTFFTGLLGLGVAPLGTLFGVAAYICLTYIILIATWFANLPFAALVAPTFSAWWILIMYGMIGCGFYKMHHWLWSQNTAVPLSVFSDWVLEEEITVLKRLIEKERFTVAKRS